MAKDNKLTFIDLFAGAGGLSEGFVRTGFEPIAHIEIDRSACYTLKTRIAFYYLKQQDRLDEYNSYLKGEIDRRELYSKIPEELKETVINQEISKDTIPHLFKKIDQLKGDNKVTILIGGPPCQSYSLPGRAASDNGMKDDHRNYLYLQYGAFLKKYKPTMFVFENVPDLYSADDGRYYRNMKKYFRRLGYDVDDQILNAADFGVVQNRERVIIIGCKKGNKFEYPQFDTTDETWRVKDIFSDLPWLKAGTHERCLPYPTSALSEYLEKHEIRNGVDFVTLNYARPHNKNDLKIYRQAIEWMKEGNRLRFTDVPEERRTQKNITAFLDRFKVVDDTNPSHTLIAHIAKDGHYYIHPDIKQLRSITVREAARIQSFPDDYYFESIKEGQNRTAAFKQIGNAVPPLLAVAIAKEIRKSL